MTSLWWSLPIIPPYVLFCCKASGIQPSKNYILAVADTWRTNYYGTLQYVIIFIRLAPRAGNRGTESRAVIGYPSGQNGAILPARDTGHVPQGTFIMLWRFIPYNKSFIDQACSVKMAGYWPRSFFACLWTETKSRSINTQKKNLANIQPSWPNKLGQ